MSPSARPGERGADAPAPGLTRPSSRSPRPVRTPSRGRRHRAPRPRRADEHPSARTRAPTRSASCSTSTCSRCSRPRAPPAPPARSPRCRCRSARRRTPTCAWCSWSASARPTRDDFRRAGAALARAVRDRHAVATTIPAVEPDDRPGAVRRRRDARLLRLPLALGARPSTPPVAASCWPAWPTTDRPALQRAMAIGGASWRARTPRLGALEPQEPGLARRPGRARWPGRPGSRSGLGREGAGRRGVRRHPRRRPGLGHPAAADPARLHPGRRRRAVRRPSCWSARASPSTPAGYSIKPGEAMVNMKRDMTGGAVVIVGARRAGRRSAARSGWSAWSPPPRTPSAATRCAPATWSATTAAAPPRSPTPTPRAGWCSPTRWPTPSTHLDPAVLVDVATLTGAIKVALGPAGRRPVRQRRRAGRALLDAGARAGEPLWRLPLAADYEEKLSSKVADADNAPGGPGAITAALFLQHFVGDVPWAHLDIASAGDAPDDASSGPRAPPASVPGCC